MTRASAAALIMALGAGCVGPVGRGGHLGSTGAPSSAGRAPATSSVGAPPPRPSHVVVVIFENKGVSQIVGDADAPYLTSLAQSGALLTDAHGIAHPSQPNYLALLAGTTDGVTDDSCPRDLGAAPNLASQLFAAGRTFAGYAESMPAVGFTGCSANGGRYVRKHNPWVDFDTVPASANRPYSQFPSDFSQLPTVSFVVPNMCDDMHDCPVSTGDRWARAQLSAYAAWAEEHDSLLVVTFDEDSGASANHIATILVGSMVRPGSVGGFVNHYSVLRMLEEMYGLPLLGHAATAVPIAAWPSR